MSFTCATCSRTFSTTTNLKRHVRLFHPNTSEEPIICKTCNIPCTDKYNLKLHNSKFHRDEIPALSVPSSIEISKEKNSSDDKDETFGEDIPHEITPENTFVPVQDELAQDKNPGEVHSISNDYTGNLLELSIIQQKNTDFIKQNTSHILKLLEITKELVTDFESSKIYQAKKLKTKTYNCRACDRLFENSASLASHRSKYHRINSTTILDPQRAKKYPRLMDTAPGLLPWIASDSTTVPSKEPLAPTPRAVCVAPTP